MRGLKLLELLVLVLAYLLSLAWIFDLIVLAATRRLPARLGQIRRLFGA